MNNRKRIKENQKQNKMHNLFTFELSAELKSSVLKNTSVIFLGFFGDLGVLSNGS